MRQTDVKFIATYESGHQEWLWMDPKEALAGDHVAGRIARLQQQQGNLPEGNIMSVKRVVRHIGASLHQNVPRVFNPDAKEHPWDRRKLKREE